MEYQNLKKVRKIRGTGTANYMDPNYFHYKPKLDTLENEKVDIWSLGILAYELFFYKIPFGPWDVPFDKLVFLLNQGEYFIDLNKCRKISKQFLSFLNVCLQEEQKIRPLTDELLQFEFIVRDPDYFTYLDIKNYKEANYPKGDYLKTEGIITMNINDNRNINANFDVEDKVQ